MFKPWEKYVQESGLASDEVFENSKTHLAFYLSCDKFTSRVHQVFINFLFPACRLGSLGPHYLNLRN